MEPENPFSQLYSLIEPVIESVIEPVGVFVRQWLPVAALIWFGLIVTLSAFIVIVLQKIKGLREEDIAEEEQALEVTKEVEPVEVEEWEKIKQYLESRNESDWKLAILEADKMLDKLVQKMGYPGNNLGERLKAVEPSDFRTLNSAWEAHKVRNAIAHDQGYKLTKRSAARVIGLYEQVFKEFHYI